MHLIEQIGTGIRRFDQLMVDAKLPKPIFKMEGMFVVILKRPLSKGSKTSEKTRVETRVKIINAIEKNNQITTPMLAELINLTIKEIEYQLNILKKQGLIEHFGPNKGG